MIRNLDKRAHRAIGSAAAACLLMAWASTTIAAQPSAPASSIQSSTTSRDYASRISATATTALIENGEPVPIPKELTDWLEKNGFKIVNLVDGTGQIKAVDVAGHEIKPCGQIEGTRIAGECNIADIIPTASNQIGILGYTPKATGAATSKDDPCVWQIISNRLVQICW